MNITLPRPPAVAGIRTGLHFPLLLVLIFLVSACSSRHPLVPTPNIYVGGAGYPVQEIPQVHRTTSFDFLYITDRLAESDKEGNLLYKAKRSEAMVVGEITVDYGQDISWADLTDASQTPHRKKRILLEISKITELIKFPEIPLPFGMQDGKIIALEPEATNYAEAEAAFQAILKERLAAVSRKDVVLFVHGFNNEFRDAGLALADIWHFTGRIGVPIFYTWPAASGGLFGYFKDRESGEFTVFHFKELLRMLSRTEGLRNIHIVAHSRGTDIVTTALRELVIEARAAGLSPRKKYKIENLFLAAPDMDFGVVGQRLIAEKFGPAFGQITVYMNGGDSALGFSQFLMSGLRFGRLNSDGLTTPEREIFSRVKNVNFVNVKDVSSFFGHDYYRTHPGVLSDIAVTIRECVRPGTQSRPLILDRGNFWILPKDYLLAE
ncbi:MAG: alpha/beta hydrolase [Alphaproteobacteria bacterium]|nr:MAG: alpha/beta hydrolase [Alphaproteobacteria bacterium]